MRKESPSLNDLLFFNGLMQKPQHVETKNEINVLPEAPLEANNEIDVSDALLDLFSPYKEQKEEKESKASSLNSDKYIEVSEMPHDLTSAQNKQMVEQETKAPSKTNEEIDISKLMNDLFSQKDQEVKVVPNSPKKTDNEFDALESFRDFISAPKEKVVEQETKAPSQTEGEIEVSEMIRDLFPQKKQDVKKLPKILPKSDEKIYFSELLNVLFPQREQKVNVAPKSDTKANSEFDVSELFRDLISGPEEQMIEQVPKASLKTENDIDVLKLLNDLVSPQNVEVVEIVPMTFPNIGKEEGMRSSGLIDIIPLPKEPEEPVVVEIDEKIISINMPLNDLAAEFGNSLTTDEKKENAPKPNLTSKINELISDVISPLEQRLLDEFERALVPLNDIIELGANIKNSPFTEKEIENLKLFKVYMQTAQEAYSEFKSQVHSFGVNRFYETAMHTNYHLSKKQNNQAINVLNDATERVKAESKVIYDLILKPENQQLIKSIENKKSELSASLRAISLALKANYAHLIDDDKMEDVKTKRLSIIEENSKLMIQLLQSNALESLKNGIIEHVDNLVDIMNKLPMKITLSYMF